jgi:hypothetical protein
MSRISEYKILDAETPVDLTTVPAKTERLTITGTDKDGNKVWSTSMLWPSKDDLPLHLVPTKEPLKL